MGWKISDLQGASLPLAGGELLEVAQGGNSRSVRVSDLLPGFESTLAADLASNDNDELGAALIGYAGSTVAAALAEIESELSSKQYVTPDQFGGIGTVSGDTDATAGLKAALASGYPVRGVPGMRYGITGSITLPAVAVLSDIKLKQLAAGPQNLRELYQGNGTVCRLFRVVVDRNGNGAGGQISNSAGIYISNCASPARIMECEVTGNNYGDGITVTDSKVELYNNYVHDMTYGTVNGASAPNDVMQGIWLIRCTGQAFGNRVERLRGQWSGQAPLHKFTRGFAIGGSYDLVMIGNTSDTVDQGFDYSGDENNRRITAVANRAINSFTWGHKCANTVTDSTFIGCTAYRSGLAGFVASAPPINLSLDTSDKLTQNITYIGCVSTFNGWSDYNPGSGMRGGFLALNSAAYPDFPRGIKWIGCRSYGAANSQVGFRNDVPVPGTGTFWNEAINCDSRDSVVDFAGVSQGITTKTTPTANGSTGNWTDMTWSGVSVDRMAGNMSASEIVIRRSGLYMVSFGLTLSGHATGDRAARVMLNGSTVVPGSYVKVPAVNADDKAVAISTPVLCNAGDLLKVQVFQNSGTTISTTSGSFSAALISPGQGRT